MARIDVISSSLVQMSKNGHAISHPNIHLTPWDLHLILLAPIQKGILFYKPESQELEKTLVHHLKTSLSRTLDFFPPLAGCLGTITNTDNTVSYFINCNNSGVEFTHAVVHEIYMSDILVPKYTPKFMSDFFPLNGVLNYEGISKPLVGVQVTELEDGFFIGLTANHSVVDGTSFWHFFKSWSEISRGFSTISKIPVFERCISNDINLPIHLPPLDQNPSPRFVPPPLLERVFNFSKESLAKLKSKANSEAGTDKISSLQALLAHLWQSIARCRRKSISDVQIQEVTLTMMIGTRTRIPLEDGYFGNAIYGVRTEITEHELLKNGLGIVAQNINDLVNQQTKEVAIKFVEDWAKNPKLIRMGGINFLLSSSPRHDVYGCDFGWGKPTAVRSGKSQKTDGKMTVFPAAEPGGIDLELCLSPETLYAIEEDADFMEAVTI